MTANEENIQMTMSVKNGNGTANNNNHDEFKMDMKSNQAERDPLTGSRTWSKNQSRLQRLRQRIAKPNFFMAVFLLAYVFQGTYFTYFVSVMRTIEKVFHVSSSFIAIILNFSEIGQICTSLVLTYYAGRGHRPRFIAVGSMVFAIAAFTSFLPHLIFHSTLYNYEITTSPTKHDVNATNHPASAINDAINFNLTKICSAESYNASDFEADSTCNSITEDEAQANKQMQVAVMIMLSLSLLLIGIGQTALMTLGIPFIDDNVKAAQSSLYIAITIGVRILGPLLGYYLASYCLSLYVDLSQDVDPSDNNFIGAWWLGIIIVSACMFCSSVIMFLFPKNLHNDLHTASEKADENGKHEKSDEANGSHKPCESLMEVEVGSTSSQSTDFVSTIKRHLKNKIFVLRTISSIFHLIPLTGICIFLPRYLETQFLMPPNQATFFSGTFGILAMGFGISITGIISAKYQLTAKKWSHWVVISTSLTALGMLLLMVIGCEMDNYKGLVVKEGSSFSNNYEFQPLCNSFNSSCPCDAKDYNPICGSDGNIYFSACHIGCKTSTKTDSLETFSNCECLDESFTATPTTCNTGRCDIKLYLFIIIFAFTVFIHASSEVGRMVIIMRCVPPQDKTMAMGIIQFSLGVFSNIPCPNIYAFITSASCIMWNRICGQNGYCSLYDADTFRVNFFGVSLFFMSIALITDILILMDSDNIEHKTHLEAHVMAEKAGEENLLKSKKDSEENSTIRNNLNDGN